MILDAGRATLELADPAHAAQIDEVEVGRRVAGHIRVAFRVDDVDTVTRQLQVAGAELLAPPPLTLDAPNRAAASGVGSNGNAL